MTPADLERVAEWERLANEATPAPWCAFNGAINSWRQDERGEAIVGCMGEVVIGCGRVDCAKPRVTDAAFIAAARTAVPEMARMLAASEEEHAEMLASQRRTGDLLEEMTAERDKWREVAELWEQRAHQALMLANAAGGELLRLRETHSPKSVEEVLRDTLAEHRTARQAACAHMRCEAGSGNCLDCGMPRPVNGWQDGGGS